MLRITFLYVSFCFLFISVSRGQTVTLKQIGKETILFSDLAGTPFNQNFYSIENTGALYKTDLNTGVRSRLGNVTYKRTKFMFLVNAQIFTIEQDGSMNRTSISTGDWSVVSPINTWNTIEGVVVVGNRFYTIENGALNYHPTMDYKVKKQVGGQEFYEFGNYAYTDSTLHTVIGGSLYRVDIYTGQWKMIGAKKAWKFAKDYAVIGNKLYSIESPSSLYETDLSTGAKKLLDDKQFKEARVLFADSGKLYAVFSQGLLYEVVWGN